MKAIMFRGADKPLSCEQIPDPTPGHGEMIVKVSRCGICGSDVHLTQEHGFFPDNAVLGHEFMGEVVEIGQGVEGFRIGDRVTAMPPAGCGTCAGCLASSGFMCEHGVQMYGQAFAEYAPVAARATIKLPSSLSLTDGALVEPLAVSLHGVKLGGIGPGSRVLVLGAGSIALGAIHWARKLGASRIVAMSRSASREKMALAMSADAYVQSGEGEAERVAEALGGMPDVVLETIGVPGALMQSIQHVRPMGTVVSLGFCTRPDGVIPALATFKEVRMVFSLAYSLAEFQFVADMADKGHVEPRQMVSPDLIALEDVPAMIEQLRQGRSDAKIHIDPWMNH